MTISYLNARFPTMKKMKNSRPQVPHVQQVRPVGQEPQAPDLRRKLKKNKEAFLRH
jgi:hypothetical protein